MANSAKSLKSRTCGRLYSCDTLIEGLAQDLQDVAAELRQLIQEEYPVVRQRHLAGHGDLAAADPPYSRDGML